MFSSGKTGRWLAFCLLILPVIVLGKQGETTAQQNSFPQVVSYDVLDEYAPQDFRISNDAAFMFQPFREEIFVLSLESTTDIVYHGASDIVTAGWSASNRYFAVASTGENHCTFGAAETYLTIIDMQTREKNSLCIPLDMRQLSLTWSPFADTVLFANETWLLDLEDRTMTRDSYENGLFVGSQIEPVTGYGRYVWNPNTQTPSGVIDLRTTVYIPTSTEPFGPVEPPTIEKAWLEHCSLDDGRRMVCNPLIDITNDYPGVFVSDWQVANSMLAWLAVESNANEPLKVQGVSRDQYRDTVLYVTNLSTLETREIFRLSELDVENVFTGDLDWSPDGNTIGLHLSGAISPGGSEQHLLVLHLDWGT